MPKRALSTDSQNRLLRGIQVAGASERAVHELWNIFHDEDEQISRGFFTDMVEEGLAPWKEVTSAVSFKSEDGHQQEIRITDLRRYLEKVCLESTCFREALIKASSGTGSLTPVLYCDEATAGNVLAVDKARKAALFYMGYIECWHLLKHEAMWIPLCCVQSQCVATLQGGLSRIMSWMVEHFLCEEFTNGFLAHPDLTIKHAQKAFFLGDLDAVRAVYSLKGSAGLRCCILCKNVVKAHSGVVEHDPYFVEISAASGFDPNSDLEIFSICDTLSHCRNKSELAQREKVSGITYDPDSLMLSPENRGKLPPSNILNDYMHVYLCNGVASWEIALLVEKICSHTNLTRELLSGAAVAAGWRGTSDSIKCRPHYVPGLFHERMFGDGLYKGQAHQTAAIVPLLRYYLDTVVGPSGQLPTDVIESFTCLSNCVSFISKLSLLMRRISEKETQHLDRLQRLHQQLFAKVYPDHIKPKHHVRFHLPEQFLKTGVFLSCECLESRHKQYKSGVANHQRSTIKNFALFSRRVLLRFLQINLKFLQEKGLAFWQLAPPIQEATLDDKLSLATMTLMTSERCFT